MSKKVLEKTVVTNIKKALEKHYPGFYFKVHGSAFQKVGIPDLVGLHKGRFIAVEVKAPGKEGNLTKIQEACIQKIKLAGGIAFMSSSPEHTLEELKNELTKISSLSRGRETTNQEKEKGTTLHGSRNRKNTNWYRNNEGVISRRKNK